ncbi:MAG: hypothetical protein GWN55_01500, partial [Phycisphaerae bacterium]|nr:hypothetical protein [Phycisphaerae bacterium]NIP52258.1 hypothetical protein [Phycisphaerae bacterium]NIU08886.1 hypothetical protein [Phycisphaerae bacterium]NIV00007.1 hypothetical protein [Phycisphaerae bacterium]NIW98515.1 hypothetical protein [Phycisphaerae bacterium]
MMAAGTGLDIYGKLKAGKDAKEQAYKAAELRVQEAGMIAGMTQERLHDLEREKYYAVGAARALGAHAGVKVGTGSMLTQEKAIEGAYRRKQEIL